MSLLGLLLLGFALADLGHSVRPVRWLPESIAAALVVLLGLCLGIFWVVPLVIGLLTFGWGFVVREGFGRGRPLLPLLYLVLTVGAAVALAPLAPVLHGWLVDWFARSPWVALGQLAQGKSLLLAGAGLAQLSTGNVVVRLVLAVTGTVSPAKDGSMPPTPLKGGRLLGPAERLLILGLGVAGNLTAASIVVAAKGLLRFPELSSRKDQERIHQITEYFLVGSMVSWLFALGAVALCR